MGVPDSSFESVRSGRDSDNNGGDIRGSSDTLGVRTQKPMFLVQVGQVPMLSSDLFPFYVWSESEPCSLSCNFYEKLQKDWNKKFFFAFKTGFTICSNAFIYFEGTVFSCDFGAFQVCKFSVLFEVHFLLRWHRNIYSNMGATEL